MGNETPLNDHWDDDRDDRYFGEKNPDRTPIKIGTVHTENISKPKIGMMDTTAPSGRGKTHVLNFKKSNRGR